MTRRIRPVEVIKYLAYVARGRKPFTTGYTVYKERAIARVLAARGDFEPGRDGPGYGLRLDERIVEYPWLFSRLPAAAGRLLDAGSALNFDYVLDHPALQAKQVFISTLAPEGGPSPARPNVSYVYEDLRDTCYRNEYFDWIVCLSTLEHVGLDNTRFYTPDPVKREHDLTSHLDVLTEMRRVLRPGGRLYLTVPFGRHRDHGWFQVFDADMIDRLLAAFAPAAFVEQHFRYERDGWRPSSRSESRDATYVDHSATSRLDPDRAAAARAVVCLELTR